MFRKPKKLAGRLVQKKKTNSKNEEKEDDNIGSFRRSNKKQANSSSDEDEDDDTSKLLESFRPQKKQKSSNDDTSAYATTKTKTTVFQSLDPSQELTAKDLATRTAEYHPVNKDTTTTDKDETTEVVDGKKIYKGQKEQRNKFWAGPLKASSFVRTTCRFDYQPDICKDYKDTGFCGFGDTCIYLHDRGDTMTGWQLEKQWEETKKKEQEQKEKEMNQFITGQTEDDNDDDNHSSQNNKNDLPFACYLCRNHFTNPVVTTCGHCFCESCILSKFKTEPNNKCPICQKDTHGILNYASKLEAKKRKLVGSNGTWKEYQETSQKSTKTASP